MKRISSKLQQVIPSGWLAVALLLATGVTSVGAEGAGVSGHPPRTVAVLDFSATDGQSNRWLWASSGIADLLGIQLQRQGMTVLDRDLIKAVLTEQRLAASGATTREYLALSRLLNARHLITGRVQSLTDGRFRVEAFVFSVETIETVTTAVAEGVFPKELERVMEDLGTQLAVRFKDRGEAGGPAGAAGTAPKPESLIMFYRGLDACARGQPEWGAAYFMNAASLDPDFSAPLLWEVKAYELAGFPEHAALRRKETAAKLQRLGVELNGRTNGNAGKPVLALLTPVAEQVNGKTIKVEGLTGALTDALLAGGQVRLFAFERLGDALAEHDLRLSSLFTQQHAPRYGRWLAADGLVVCRVSPTQTEDLVLHLAVVDPLTSATLAKIQGSGKGDTVAALAARLVPELLANWRTRPASVSAVEGPGKEASPQTPPGADELRPVYQGLAKALVLARAEPAKSDSHRALANAFASTGRQPSAALEIERCLRALDIRAPNADKTFLGTHRWLFWEPSPVWMSGAVGLADKQVINDFMEKLLRTYPTSLAAGILHYNLAVSDSGAGHWEIAINHAREARKILETKTTPRANGPQEMELELQAATYYLEGSSLRKLGKTEAARTVVEQGLAFMRTRNVRDFALPLGPMIAEWFGVDSVIGYGGDPPGNRTRLEGELALLDPPPARHPGADLKLDAQEIVAATNAPSRSAADWLACADRVAGLLEAVGATDPDAFNSILASARACLSEARGKQASGADLDARAKRIAGILLSKHQVPSLEAATGLGVGPLTEMGVAVMSVYDSAGLKEGGWMAIQPLFGGSYPVELSLNLLLQLSADAIPFERLLFQAAARVTAGTGGTNQTASDCIKLGQLFTRCQRFRDALEAYSMAITAKATPGQCPGFLTALAEVALESYPASAREEANRIRQRLELPLIEPSWSDWFALGRKYQAGRDYDLNKAALAYQAVIGFLENPERGGFYRFVTPMGGGPTALSWGKAGGEMDMLWRQHYDARWYSAALYLAQCLIDLDRKEEGAQWLRRIALKAGGDRIDLLKEATTHSSSYDTVPLGVRAAEMLKNLHREGAAFGTADGPYKLPNRGPKAPPTVMPPLPEANPEIVRELTNVLKTVARETRPSFADPRFQAFVQKWNHDAVPALLSLVPKAGELWDEASLAWMLEQTATAADTPWLVPACRQHFALIALAYRLDPRETAEALAVEWRIRSWQGFTSPMLVWEILRVPVRPLFPLVLEEVSEKRINHHSHIFHLDTIVRRENSEELTQAFREALASCLRAKLQQADGYELSRISKVALSHGVSEGIQGLLQCEGTDVIQLRKDLGSCVDLPARDEEIAGYLRANLGKWKWNVAMKKFALPDEGKR